MKNDEQNRLPVGVICVNQKHFGRTVWQPLVASLHIAAGLSRFAKVAKLHTREIGSIDENII